jgi:hypothetical protein
MKHRNSPIQRGATMHHRRSVPAVAAPSDNLVKTSPSGVVVTKQPAAGPECKVKASIGRYFAFGSSEEDALLGLFFKVAFRNQNLVLLP